MKSRSCFMALAMGVTAAISGTSVAAATVNVATDEGVVHITEDGIRTRIRNGTVEYHTATYGTDLIGMQVTAGYADGFSETLSWADLSSSDARRLGGVSSSRLSLSYQTSDWMLSTTSRLTSLFIDAATGNAMFDILRGISDGTGGDTVGTKIGFEYHTSGGDDLLGEIGVTYENGVVVRGLERGTDTFTRMLVDYSGLENGGLLGSTFFRSDLDSLATAGDLNPEDVSTVPLPAGLPLLVAGLGLLAIQRKRRS